MRTPADDGAFFCCFFLIYGTTLLKGKRLNDGVDVLYVKKNDDNL